MRLAVAQIDDLQLPEAVLALARDEVIGEEVDRLDAHRLAIGDDFGPVLLLRVGDRRADHAVVDAGVVGEEVEAVAAMVAVVLVPFLAGDDQARRRSRIARRNHALFGRGLAVGVDEDPVAAERPVDLEVVQIVLLFEDQRVVLAAESVAVEAPLPLGRILDGVEDRLVVGGPDERTDFLRHAGLDVVPSAEIAHVQRVLAIADVVGGVREEVAVVARLEPSDAHELLPLGQLVHVEHHFFRRVERLLAQEDRVLFSFLGARVVVPAVLTVRDVGVRLLDMAEHLVVQLLLQRRERRRHRRGVRVLGGEIGEDFRIALLADPGVVVDARVAVDRRRLRHLLGDRRLRRFGGGDEEQQGDDGRESSFHGWPPLILLTTPAARVEPIRTSCQSHRARRPPDRAPYRLSRR